MKISPQQSQSGIALIMVLLMCVVLGILAARFAYTMKVETKLARNATFDADMEWLGRSGIELARYHLSLPSARPNGQPVPADYLAQVWAGAQGLTNESVTEFSLKGHQIGDGMVDVTIEDLDRKININTVLNWPPPQSHDFLMSVLTTMIGVDGDQAETIVASLQDWRDPDDKRTSSYGAESEDYALKPNPGYPPHMAKNGPIDDLSELLMVHGVTPAIFWGSAYTRHWQPPKRRGESAFEEVTYPVGLVDLFVPVSSGKVNLSTASPTVVEAMTGGVVSQEIIQQNVITPRNGPDGIQGTEDDEPLLSPPPLLGAGPMPGGVPGGPAGARPGMPGAPGMPPGGPLQFYQLLAGNSRSYYFEATVDAKIGGRSRKYIALLRRLSPRDIQIMNMYWKEGGK